MNIFKKEMALLLTALLVLSPTISMAEDVDSVTISDQILIGELEQEEADYIEFSGKISEINVIDKDTSIIVTNDEKDSLNELRVYLGDSIILSDKTMDVVSKDLLKEDMEVSIYYHKDTPMGLSNPPVLTPNAIVIRETKEPISVMVSKFDEELLNDKGDLYLLVSDKTNIVDAKGSEMTEEDIKNRDLLVFYSIVLTSYPGQTNPEKIIILPKEEVLVEVKEVVLNKQLVFVNDQGVTMIPLRFVSESFGYDVKWNSENRSIEIQRGSQWSLITVGEDKYNFARMNIELGTAPIILNDKTFVPLNFAEQVLITEVEIMENGSIKIVQDK